MRELCSLSTFWQKEPSDRNFHETYDSETFFVLENLVDTGNANPRFGKRKGKEPLSAAILAE